VDSCRKVARQITPDAVEKRLAGARGRDWELSSFVFLLGVGFRVGPETAWSFPFQYGSRASGPSWYSVFIGTSARNFVNLETGVVRRVGPQPNNEIHFYCLSTPLRLRKTGFAFLLLWKQFELPSRVH
jgi:hypothetical protein